MSNVWKMEGGKTNGVCHKSYFVPSPPACIMESEDRGIILSINGYQFSHESIKEAKLDAVERIKENRGVYLNYEQLKSLASQDSVKNVKTGSLDRSCK